jgi:hypothetical protein
MSSPKEKAKELVNQFLEKIPFADTYIYKDWKKEMNDKAKQCALIAVDEILNELQISYNQERIDYYLDLRNEINKL